MPASVAPNGALHGPPARERAEHLLLAMTVALDAVDYGMLILAADQRVLHANAAARSLLDDGTPFRLLDGRLVATGERDTRALARLIGGVPTGERRLDLFERGGRRFRVAAARVAGTGALDSRASMLLTISRATPCHALTLQVFASSMRLTASETRVLEALVAGRRPTEIAEAHRIQPSTVRTHIRNLLGKVGAAGMRDLLTEVSTLPPVPHALYA